MVERRSGTSGNDSIKAKRTIRKPKPSNPFNKEFDNWDIDGGIDGNDTLIGGDKRDSLRGGSGIDSLLGGKGDDRYFVDDPNDIIVEKDGEGDDLVFSKAANFTLPNNVENLDIDEPNLFRVSATGNSLDNDMFGTDSAQEDVLNGLGGNDKLFGFANGDTLNGGSGNDTLDGGSGNDSLIGGTGSDSLTGDSGADTLKGSAANIVAREVDTLVGGSDIDLFILGTGVKYYDNFGGSDFALIKDFALGTDKLHLGGTRSQYRVDGINGDVGLFTGNELIAIFEQNSVTSITAALDDSNTTTFFKR